MTEAQAKSQAIKETDHCYVLAQSKVFYGQDNYTCLERIFTKGGCEEIRLAWWKNGKQVHRPAKVNAVVDWGKLFTDAVNKGVFTAEDPLGMIKALI